MKKSNTKERNYGAFYMLLKALPHADKDSLVLAWTRGRTTSLREMTNREYQAMCRELRSETQDLATLRKWRSTVLKLLQRYGIDTTDWARVNAFTQQKRIAGKVFRQLSTHELMELAKKMRAIISLKAKPLPRVNLDELGAKIESIAEADARFSWRGL